MATPAAPKPTVPMTAAQRTRDQLAGDYPPESLAWLDQVQWSGPVQIPLSQINWTAGAADWAAADADKAKIQLFKRRIANGHRKPVIAVKTPGSRLVLIIDGHGRSTACKALGVPVTAYLGTAATASGPWQDFHSRQKP